MWSLTKYQKQGFRVDYLSKLRFGGGQHQAKIDKKSIKKSFKSAAQLIVHLGSQHGSQNPSKTSPKSKRKINEKSIPTSIKILYAF